MSFRGQPSGKVQGPQQAFVRRCVDGCSGCVCAEARGNRLWNKPGEEKGFAHIHSSTKTKKCAEGRKEGRKE